MTQAGANGAFVFNDSVAPVHFGPNAVQLMQNNNAVCFSCLSSSLEHWIVALL